MAGPTHAPNARLDLATFCAIAVLQVVPLWCVALPPMVDLPQHAAQLAMFDRFLAGDPMVVGEHALNWFTPYLAGYALTWALAQGLGLVVAIKVVLSLSVLGVPFATRLLVTRSGGDPRWAWLSFPIAYGYAFNWGFYNFIVAAPLGIAAVGLAWRYVQAPRPRAAIWLWASLAGLFFCHVLVVAIVGLSAGLMALAVSRRPADLAARLAPFLALLPLVIGWTILTAPSTASAPEFLWAFDAGRPVHLFSGIVGARPTWSGAAGGLLLLALPVLLGARPHRDPVRWMPLAATCAVCLFLPRTLFGTAFLFERFTLFVLPFWLFALERPAHAPATVSASLRRTGEIALAVVPAVLLLVTLSRFVAFDAESRDARDLLRRLPDGARVLSLIAERDSLYAPTPVYLHFPSWYTVDHRGTVDFSFASFFPNLLRYRDDRARVLPAKFEWSPRLDWVATHGDRFDLIVVRSSREPQASLLGAASPPFERIAQSGPWWVYARAGKHATLATSAGGD